MNSKILGSLLALWCSVAAASSASKTSDLNEAFIAAVGQQAPVTRNVKQALESVGNPDKVTEYADRAFSLKPERLIPLGGNRFALVIQEIDENGAHAFPGALALAYLTKDGNAWRSEKFWPEIAYVGNSGKPNYKSEVRQFGGRLLYLSTSKYCQMGGCEDDVDVVLLEPTAPRYVGGFAGDSQFPTIFPHPLGASCESYDYKVSIAPPALDGDLFSVTYRGWTAPPNRRSPKHSLLVRADAVLAGNAIEFHPKVIIPDCGK